jgi:hypothetical protein
MTTYSATTTFTLKKIERKNIVSDVAQIKDALLQAGYAKNPISLKF